MTLFHQIIPRLARSQPRRAEAATGTAGESGLTLKPAYELNETTDAWGLAVRLPGVAKGGLEFTVEEGLIRIRGARAWSVPSGWTSLYRESVDAPFELTLEHDHTVDVDKIHAELKDGVLRVSLPKAEAVKPRKITVN